MEPQPRFAVARAHSSRDRASARRLEAAWKERDAMLEAEGSEGTGPTDGAGVASMWPTTKIAPRCRRCELPLSLTCRPGKSPRRFEATCPGCGRVLVLRLQVEEAPQGRRIGRNDRGEAPIQAKGDSRAGLG